MAQAEERNDELLTALTDEFKWDQVDGKFDEEQVHTTAADCDPLWKLIAKYTAVRPKFVEIKFCRQCNNMLYPKENVLEKKLMYRCKICEYSEESDDACVYINSVTADGEVLEMVTPDLATDPTLGRSREGETCPDCGHDEAVQFQTPVSREKSNMRLYYVCTNARCRKRWAGEMEEGDE